MEDTQLLRYSRQIMLPELDVVGQEALLGSHVMIVGVGGLGCPVAMYLAAAGVGRLTLVDGDRIELTNLQRQIAHGMNDIGRFKVTSASETISELNPDVRVFGIHARLDDDSLNKEIARCDLVVDCTDNFNTRFLLNRLCVQLKKPLVSGAAIRFEGQLTVFDARQENSPCYRCLYGDNSSTSMACSENGVLSPIVGVMGSLQALEAIKVLTGVGDTMVGRLLLWDGKAMSWREMKISKDPKCPICSA